MWKRKVHQRWQMLLLAAVMVLMGLSLGAYAVTQTADRALAAQTAVSSEIQLNRTELTLGFGETYQLTASVTGGDSVSQWVSTDKTVLSVTDGKVKALSVGKAAIKVRTKSGLLAICRITIMAAPTSAALSLSEVTLGVGETYQFSCRVPSGTAAWVRTYTTSNKNIVPCTGSGAIQGRKPGTAVVTVKLYNGVTAQCKVTVKKAPTSAALSLNEMTLGVGESYRFYCTVPDGTAARVRDYSVSNKNVLTLNGSTITAKSTGTAVVTVKLYNGVTAQCRVTVKKAPTSAALSLSEVTLGVGESYRFYCTVPDGTAARVRDYSVNNKNVLTLNGNTITAKSTGTAVVTVKLYNGVTAQCRVTVQKPPTSAALNLTELTLGVGESYALFCRLPSGTASYAKTYTAENKNFVTCSNNVLTGRKPGTTTVTVKLYNGVTAQCKVTVRQEPTMVSLNYSALSMGIGETAALKCVLPSGTASYHKTFSVSDRTIVSCDANGQLKALSEGTATVTVKLYNDRSAQCKVTVAPPPQYIGVADDLAVLDIGETFRITPQTEAGLAYSGVTYTSGDKNVATVSSDGLVRAVGAGTTDITLTTYNGYSAKVAVIVYGTKSGSYFPDMDETARYLNQATLRPMKTNCPQLDDLVGSILSSVTNSGMTTAQKVQAVYDYLAQNSTYGYGYIPVELPGSYYHYSDYWIVTSAYPLLKNHVGTCENFSAALTVLLRRIGLEANSVEGLVGMRAGGKGGHYWTDVVIKGKHCVFDAQVENNNLGYGGTVYHYWYGMKPEYNYRSYEYQSLIPVIDFSYA